MTPANPDSSSESFAQRRMTQDRERLIESLRRTGNGDRSAFEDVYQRTAAKLFGICLRIFPERHDAEEALQEAYITIWNKAATFDPARASPITWLATLTRNRAIDRLRAMRGRGQVSLDAAGEVADPAPDARAQLLAAEADGALGACIETLDRSDADYIRTAFLKGATYAELAARDSLPLGTVKSRVRRALLKLRQCLAQ